MASTNIPSRARPAGSVVGIPGGTKVRHRRERYEGTVEGLTAIVSRVAKPRLDGHVRYSASVGYRVDVGTHQRKLATEEDLLMLVDPDDLIIMERVNLAYRRRLTTQLRRIFTEGRFTT